MGAYPGYAGVHHSHTTHCAVAERRIQKRETTMKKSIAVLSLTIAGALGLAACGGYKVSAPSGSASASASASATASASPSAAAQSSSPSAAETTKAAAKSTQTSSADSSGATEASKGAGDNSQQSDETSYSAAKEFVKKFQEKPGVKKTESSDGTAYYNDEVAYVEGKDGTVIGIKSDGEWTSMSSDGVTVFVDKDGSWVVTNSKDNLYTVVKADGTGAIMNTKTLEEGTDVSAIKTPKTPGRIDGFNGTPITPVKATKIGKFSEVADSMKK